MFKIFVIVDKHQGFKSLTVKRQHSSSNAENSFVNNFIIADYFLLLRVTIACKPT